MKYNFIVDHIDETNSHGKILKQIQPGSIVLECGCATGYMTKYMNEKLNCKVYIIECEQAAFDIAKQYAEDGICTDLLKDEWSNKFQGMKFDYIIFADVLEHLYSPETVLKKASELLKSDGKIIVSLPNIGHNDILLKLYDNHWDYTSLGLLDNTHIKFWGNANLEKFASQANLAIVMKDYIIAPTFFTEQNATSCSDDIFLNRIRWRKGGEIYQFVLTLQLSSYVQQKHIELCCLSSGFKEARLYYTTKEFTEYSEDKCIYAKSEDGEYLNFRFEININELVLLRFDPVEYFGMVVNDIKITSNIGELYAKPSRAIILNGDVVFCDADPSYEIEVTNDNIKWVQICIKARSISEKEIITIIQQQKEEIELLNDLINNIYKSTSWKIAELLRKSKIKFLK